LPIKELPKALSSSQKPGEINPDLLCEIVLRKFREHAVDRLVTRLQQSGAGSPT
jgi:hypothetical protein